MWWRGVWSQPRLGLDIHVGTLFTFIILGGILASLNHTRFDVRIPPSVYDVRVHDVHHRIGTTNLGQYIMLWDRVFGTYRPYDATAKAK